MAGVEIIDDCRKALQTTAAKILQTVAKNVLQTTVAKNVFLASVAKLDTIWE